MTDVIVLLIDCKWGRSLCAIGLLCRPLTSCDMILITLITQRVMGGTYFCTTELEQYSILTGERQLVYETISHCV